MRILLFPNSYPPYWIGGLETAVRRVACGMVTRGCKVTVVSSAPGYSPHKEISPQGVVIHRLPLRLPYVRIRHGFRCMIESLVTAIVCVFLAPLSFLSLLNVIRTSKPDMVNLHYVGENAAFCLAAKKLLSFPLVVNIHGADIDSYASLLSPMRWVIRMTLEVADRVLSNSAYLLREAEKISPSLIGKSIVVGNGVDLEDFVCPPAFEYGQRYVLCVAQLVFRKGVDVLIDAFKTVRDSIPGVALLIAGDGPERPRCEALVEQSGLADTVRLLGSVEPSRVPSLLAGCEAFVLPSRQESFGIAILEAMASEKAVIATRVGGVPEIIRHMENGWLVEPECPSELARAIISLLQDTQLRTRLAQEGYETVRTHFTWDQVVERYLPVFQQVGSR